MTLLLRGTTITLAQPPRLRRGVRLLGRSRLQLTFGRPGMLGGRVETGPREGQDGRKRRNKENAAGAVGLGVSPSIILSLASRQSRSRRRFLGGSVTTACVCSNICSGSAQKVPGTRSQPEPNGF